jgi:uncharacterized membrane protein
MLLFYMGKVERNWWVGLRTPWTLANDEVWLRSNRFGGRLMIVGGLVLIAGGVVGAGLWLLLVVAGSVAIAPAVQSYVVFRRLRDDQSQPT